MLNDSGKAGSNIACTSMNTSGFSARLMIGKGANTIPGSLGPQSPKKLQGRGKTMEAETLKQEMRKCYIHSKHCNPRSSQPPSKTSNCKDTHSLWKSLQDCHSSLTVANPRHFEFAVANLCFLLKAYGKELDNYVKTDIDKIFQTLRVLVLDTSKRLTTRMQLLRVIELRARTWNVEPSTECTEKVKIQEVSTCSSCKTMSPQPEDPRMKEDKKAVGLTTHATPAIPTPLSGLNEQPIPKSTGFWDSLSTIQEFYPNLPPIPEETAPNRLDCLPAECGKMQEIVNVPTSVTQCYNPISATEGCSNPPLKYSREFLLQCWDSPLCRVMPPALQHTIPHSDIYYLIKIPTFADPSFLLKDKLAPSNIQSAAWGPYPAQSCRKRHPSWSSTAHTQV